MHNEGKSVVAERFIRTLNIKIYKCMTKISKNVYIDRLDDSIVRISKYKNIFCKRLFANLVWKLFVIQKVKTTITCKYSDLKGIETFVTLKKLQKTNQNKLRVEKVINRKGNKPYAKWKGKDSSFNSWIYKKDI